MAKHLLFLLHGMGEHPEGWSCGPEGIQRSLLDSAQLYPYFRDHGRSLEEYVTPVELSYDGVFERWRRATAEDTSAVAAQAPAGWPRERLQQLGSLLRGMNPGFGVTHVLDVILWRLLPPVHNEVLADLRLQIERALETHQPTRVSMLAHSLGTSVAHDVLASMAGDLTPSTNPRHIDNAYQFANYFTVANVSRILQTSPKVLCSVVRPGIKSLRRYYVRKFWNFSHRLDPFPMVKPFAPLPEWTNDSYQQVWVDHFLHPNVHGFKHYLVHPRVHSTIINALFRSAPIPDGDVVRVLDNEFRQKQAEFLASMPARPGRMPELQALADRLLMLQDPDEESGIRNFIDLVSDYFTVLGGSE